MDSPKPSDRRRQGKVPPGRHLARLAGLLRGGSGRLWGIRRLWTPTTRGAIAFRMAWTAPRESAWTVRTQNRVAWRPPTMGGNLLSHQSPGDRAPVLDSVICAVFSVYGFCSVPPAKQAGTAFSPDRICQPGPQRPGRLASGHAASNIASGAPLPHPRHLSTALFGGSCQKSAEILD